MPDRTAELRAALEEPARLGILGADIDAAIGHARQFAPALRPARRIVDLGSGSGMPGLVLAVDDAGPRRWCCSTPASAAPISCAAPSAGWVWPTGSRWSAGRRRCSAAILPHRGAFDAVVARAFGPPAMVAECGAPLLRLGGQLLVSEPPDGGSGRWPAEGLARAGAAPGRRAAPAPGLLHAGRGLPGALPSAPAPAPAVLRWPRFHVERLRVPRGRRVVPRGTSRPCSAPRTRVGRLRRAEPAGSIPRPRRPRR